MTRTSPPPAFDFSTTINRHGLASQKWQRYEQQDIIAMWVADMDIAAPECVQTALARVVNGGVLGYGEVSAELQQAFISWCQRQYQWAPEADWLVWLPGVVPGINLAIEAWLAPEQGVAVQAPVYPPILNLGQIRGRPQQTLAFSPPATGEEWSLQTERLAAELAPEAKALVLCNPQNPLGRVYTREELNTIAETAVNRDLYIISDEIWADLILQPNVRHIPFASVSDAAAQRSITLMAASKSFNIAGLSAAVAIIPNADLRARFRRQMRGLMPDMSYMGLLASQAAWQHGGDWLTALKAHLNENLNQVATWVDAQPAVHWCRPQATYVVWLDVQELGLDDPAAAFLAAGVALSDGAPFGLPGYVRLNIGCPQAQLDAALERMASVCRR